MICSNIKCTVYSVLCMAYGVQCTVYGVRCTAYGVQCTVYSVWCTAYSVQCTVYCVQNTSIWCTVYGVHCSLLTVHCTVHSRLYHTFPIYHQDWQGCDTKNLSYPRCKFEQNHNWKSLNHTLPYLYVHSTMQIPETTIFSGCNACVYTVYARETTNIVECM